LAEQVAAVPAGQPDFALAPIFAIRLQLEPGFVLTGDWS
jgi:hypothetical protein